MGPFAVIFSNLSPTLVSLGVCLSGLHPFTYKMFKNLKKGKEKKDSIAAYYIYLTHIDIEWLGGDKAKVGVWVV